MYHYYYHFEYIVESNNLMDKKEHILKKQQCEKIDLQVYYKYFFQNKHIILNKWYS